MARWCRGLEETVLRWTDGDELPRRDVCEGSWNKDHNVVSNLDWIRKFMVLSLVYSPCSCVLFILIHVCSIS